MLTHVAIISWETFALEMATCRLAASSPVLTWQAKALIEVLAGLATKPGSANTTETIDEVKAGALILAGKTRAFINVYRAAIPCES